MQVVLDVGAGSGILSFFAIQAGARRVYAVEASSIAVYCQQLVHRNRVADKIAVIAGRIEEVCSHGKKEMANSFAFLRLGVIYCVRSM